jgi:phosphoribosylanthranilate isomerase
MLVKVCGMRDQENITAVQKLPIDMIGFIFYPKSPRFAESNKKLEKWLHGEGKKTLDSPARVGVFVDAEVENVLNRVHDFELDYVQLHGNESPEYCRELSDLWSFSSIRRASIIKAFGIDEKFDFAKTQFYRPYCKYFLFDTKGASFGGTGQRFNWELLNDYHGDTPFLLSGGIGPDSVDDIRLVRHPQLIGLDLNSKFEVSPGLKAVEKIAAFLNDLRS